MIQEASEASKKFELKKVDLQEAQTAFDRYTSSNNLADGITNQELKEILENIVKA